MTSRQYTGFMVVLVTVMCVGCFAEHVDGPLWYSTFSL